jgi:serine protease Do
MNRKQIMTLLMGLSFSMSLTSMQAQEAPKATERKEIIIREKAGKEEKMTIVVDGDKVTINGKPLAEYDGDNIIIRKKNVESFAPYVHSYPRVRAMPRIPRAPAAPFGPEAWEFSFDDEAFGELRGEPKARLGVVSEKDAKGAKLTQVMPESAAAKAGLKEGDIITAVDGKKVDGPESLSELIRAKKPEQESEITYLRDKKTKKMKVKLGASKASSPNVFYFNAPQMELEMAPHFRELEKQYKSHDKEFRELEKEYRNHDKELRELERNFRSGDWEKFRSEDMDEFRREMELMGSGNRPKLGIRIEDMEDAKGVNVIDVQAGSAAEKAGFKKGDILTHIDDKKVSNTDQARELLMQSGNKSTYPVSVLRNGKPFNMTIQRPREMKKANL